MSAKEFKTLEEQIELLKSRGLRVDNEEMAREFLRVNNYYRVSGYSLTLRKNDVFYKNACFQNISDIYMFDYELRHILLKYIEEIEVKIKSIYAYEFARCNGETAYKDSAYFTNAQEHQKIINKVDAQKKLSLKNEAYIRHYEIELKQDMPIWAYIEIFTIGDISKLYSISTANLKNAIAAQFGLTMTKGGQLLGDYLYVMTNLRNLCAHGSRLFNRIFIRKPTLNSNEKKLLIRDKAGTIDNAHLYGFVIMMRRLLSKESFKEMKAEIISLKSKFPFVSMRYYGFRDDWELVL